MKNNAKLTEAEQMQIREARAAYMREYRRLHPQKNREAIDRYWLRRAQQIAIQGD